MDLEPPSDDELRKRVDREANRLIETGGYDLLRIGTDTILASFRDWVLADRQVEVIRERIRHWLERPELIRQARGSGAGG
jgi:hypothetical protein